MARSAADTTEWVATVMRDKEGVTGVDRLTDRSIRISRDGHDPYTAGVVSKRDVYGEDIAEVLVADPSVDIVINVPAAGVWRRTGIAAANAAGIGYGGMGDLQSCIAKEDPRLYVKSEFAFIERGLAQHTGVASVTREADRLFLIHRSGLPDIRVVAIYAYELTLEHLRNARDRYGQFELVLNSNPNGKPTTAAAELAVQLGVELHMFGTMMGRLNRA